MTIGFFPRSWIFKLAGGRRRPEPVKRKLKTKVQELKPQIESVKIDVPLSEIQKVVSETLQANVEKLQKQLLEAVSQPTELDTKPIVEAALAAAKKAISRHEAKVRAFEKKRAELKAIADEKERQELLVALELKRIEDEKRILAELERIRLKEEAAQELDDEETLLMMLQYV